MSVEAKRGCGYRKINGLYIIGDSWGTPCVKLPYDLECCPVCSAGLKQSKGWTWVSPNKMFDVKDCPNLRPRPDSVIKAERCELGGICPFTLEGKHGMMWVGKRFYSPQKFDEESTTMGISKRISGVPRGFKLGETWVLLGHPDAGTTKAREDCEKCGGSGVVEGKQPGEKIPCKCFKPINAVFKAFMPTAIEKIITETQSKDEELMKDLKERGIKAVIVPDNDKDHQGTVYDKEEEVPEPTGEETEKSMGYGFEESDEQLAIRLVKEESENGNDFNFIGMEDAAIIEMIKDFRKHTKQTPERKDQTEKPKEE